MPTINRAELRAHAWLAEHVPAVHARWSIEQFRELRMAVYQAHPELHHDYLRIRRLAMHQAFDEVGLSGYEAHERIEEALTVFMTARQEVELYPDVLASLQRLSRRYSIASLTNGNADVVRIGLSPYFKVVVSAHQQIGRAHV